MLTLRAAIEAFQQELGAPINAYDWYRRSAHESGYAYIGGSRVPTFKRGRSWYVEKQAFDAAVEHHRDEQLQIQRDTEAYDRGVIRGENGSYIKTRWGGYTMRGPFHVTFRFSYEGCIERWVCNTCRQAASLEHDREECHRCADWSWCGQDCTLSRVFCSKCGFELRV
jgi:hypothetical protein